MSDGTINDVLDGIRPGEDGWQDRARAVLADEEAKGDAARSTLIAKLEAALADDTPPVDEPVEDAPIVVEPAGDGTVWYVTSSGTFHVPAGSEAEKRLVENNAERIAL